MATFPTLTPNSRTFTPGEYPHSAFAGMSGVQNRVRNSNVMLSSQLRLSFAAITESQMLSILAHYQGQQGTFLSFSIPSAIWNAVSSVNDYQLAGYGWRYIDPPSVTDAMCANAYDVELTLETVPPEGTAAAGLDFLVRTTLTAGAATATFDFSVAVLLAAGSATAGATVIGLDENVSMTLAGGAATGGSGGDPDFANVSLLLHMDGSDGSTTFTDSSSNNHTMSINDGAVTITTAQSVFGGASASFPIGGDLRTPTSSTFTFDGNFTCELWARRTATTSTLDTILSSSPSETQLMIRVGSGSPGFWFGNVRFATGFTMTLNTWHHLAIVRNGSTVTAYKDGADIGAITNTNVVTCGLLAFGDSAVANGRYFRGQIDEVRVTKGVARYTANFTPPTAPFPDS